jgi:hypothetical protein
MFGNSKHNWHLKFYNSKKRAGKQQESIAFAYPRPQRQQGYRAGPDHILTGEDAL